MFPHVHTSFGQNVRTFFIFMLMKINTVLTTDTEFLIKALVIQKVLQSVEYLLYVPQMQIH